MTQSILCHSLQSILHGSQNELKKKSEHILPCSENYTIVFHEKGKKIQLLLWSSKHLLIRLRPASHPCHILEPLSVLYRHQPHEPTFNSSVMPSSVLPQAISLVILWAWNALTPILCSSSKSLPQRGLFWFSHLNMPFSYSPVAPLFFFIPYLLQFALTHLGVWLFIACGSLSFDSKLH